MNMRVSVMTKKLPHSHSTQVASVMAAGGVELDALGAAPKLSLLSYDWEGDLNELEKIANTIQVSNHSYVTPAGWLYDVKSGWCWHGDPQVDGKQDAQFGKYTKDNARLDKILFDYPHLLTFVAAEDAQPVPREPAGHALGPARPGRGLEENAGHSPP